MSKTLLLADDSITIQKVVGITFANEEFKIVSVDNGEDAVAKAGAIKPDIVLADVVMPKLDGYQVCERLKADPGLKHIPVLLLTGAFKPFDENRSRQVGADGHIAKPFDSQTLIDKVKELVAKAAEKPRAPAAAPVPAPAPIPAAPPPPAPTIAPPRPAPTITPAGAPSSGDPFATPSEKSAPAAFSPPPVTPDISFAKPFAATPPPPPPPMPTVSVEESWGNMEATAPNFPAAPSPAETAPSPMELSMFDGMGGAAPAMEKPTTEAPENIWDVPPAAPGAVPSFSAPFEAPKPIPPPPAFSAPIPAAPAAPAPIPPPFFTPPPAPSAPTAAPSGFPSFGSFGATAPEPPPPPAPIKLEPLAPSAQSPAQSIEESYGGFSNSTFDVTSPPAAAAPVESNPFEPMPVGGFPDPFPETSSFSSDSLGGDFGTPAILEPVVEKPAPPAHEPPPRRPQPMAASSASDPVAGMTREVIEKIAWEIIPDLAESIIREEIERLKREKGVFK